MNHATIIKARGFFNSLLERKFSFRSVLSVDRFNALKNRIQRLCQDLDVTSRNSSLIAVFITTVSMNAIVPDIDEGH
jgi:hypothetical protein